MLALVESLHTLRKMLAQGLLLWLSYSTGYHLPHSFWLSCLHAILVVPPDRMGHVCRTKKTRH